MLKYPNSIKAEKSLYKFFLDKEKYSNFVTIHVIVIICTFCNNIYMYKKRYREKEEKIKRKGTRTNNELKRISIGLFPIQLIINI